MFQDPVFGNSEKAQELFREARRHRSLVGNDNSRNDEDCKIFGTFKH